MLTEAKPVWCLVLPCLFHENLMFLKSRDEASYVADNTKGILALFVSIYVHITKHFAHLEFRSGICTIANMTLMHGLFFSMYSNNFLEVV